MKSLADPLPLRTSDEWIGRRESVVLPLVIGRGVRVKLIQYDQARTKFVASGYPCEGVDTVTSGGLPVDGWSAANELDSAGKSVAMVTFTAPQPEGADLGAIMRGLQDADTGALIENPADALYAILATLGGLPFTKAQLAPFRAACAANSLVVASRVTAADSAQTVARALAESIGAKFSSQARSLAFFDPPIAAAVPDYTVENASTADDDGKPGISRDMTKDDLCNDLTVQFDFDGDQPRGSIRIVSPERVARYGASAQTLAARWLNSSAVAQAVGMRLVATSARKVWTVTAGNIKDAPDLRVGDAVAFSHAMASFPGTYPVLSRERPDLQTIEITARVPVGPAPAVAIAGSSSYFDPNAYVSLEYEQVGPDRVFTIRDTDGTTPLPNCAVKILTDGPTRQTDATGRVSFTPEMMPSGHHYELGCTVPDGRYFTFGVDI